MHSTELLNSNIVYEEVIDRKDNIEKLFRVSIINGKPIGYEWARVIRDLEPIEIGWKFDKSTICEVKEYSEKSIKYTKK